MPNAACGHQASVPNNFDFMTLSRTVLVRRIILWASLIGLFASIYLLIVYVTGGPIVCGTQEGCEIVRASKWAYTFGLPRPLLGVVFYLGVIGLLAYRAIYPHHHPRWLYRLTVLAGFIGFIESAFLTFVQWLDIKAFCMWCLTSAVMATIIFIAVWFDQHQGLDDQVALRELKFLFWSFVSALMIGAVAMMLLVGQHRTGGSIPQISAPSSSLNEEEMAHINALLYPDDLTWEGPTSSKVSVVEFIDFQCPACHAAHPEVQKVRDAFKGQIRFAWRMFPLPEHKDAPTAALGAVCADQQGALFAMGDIMMGNQGALKISDLIRDAARLKLDTEKFKSCLTDTKTRDRVLRDVQDGQTLGVSATPTFFVNDTMIEGLPSGDQLSQIIKQAM
jgi:protein-disulfide isomerase/uncharacterized membrane protein